MTEKLKQLLHEQVESVDFATPDLDAMTRAGDRRRRLRATAYVGGLAAAVVSAALVVPGLGTGEQSAGPATATEQPAALTWASGSTLYIDAEPVDVGHEVRAYVRTDDAYAIVDPDGTIWSWRDGDATEVGATSAQRPHLEADDEGTLVAWIDRQQPTVMVLDQATGEITTLGEARSAEVYGVDGRTVYWRNQEGTVASDVDAGASRIIQDGPGGAAAILDVEDGLIAFDAGDDGTRVGTGPEDGVVLPDAYSSLAAFSPDGAWISLDSDEPEVYDT